MGDNLWIFAIAIAFGLAIVLTIMTKGGTTHFLAFLMITIGIMVYGGILDSWIFVTIFVIFLIFVALKYKGKTGDL